MNCYQKIKEIVRAADQLDLDRKNVFLSWLCDHFSVEGIDEVVKCFTALDNRAICEHKSLIENEYEWCKNQPLDRIIRIAKGKKE